MNETSESKKPFTIIPFQVEEKLFALEDVARAFRIIFTERYDPCVESLKKNKIEQSVHEIKCRLEKVSENIADKSPPWEEWLVSAVNRALRAVDIFSADFSKQPVIDSFFCQEKPAEFTVTPETVIPEIDLDSQNISMTQAIQALCRLRGKDVSLSECEMALIRMISPQGSYDFDKADLVLSSVEWLCSGVIFSSVRKGIIQNHDQPWWEARYTSNFQIEVIKQSRSMSIGDVVKIADVYHLCNNSGWVEVTINYDANSPVLNQ